MPAHGDLRATPPPARPRQWIGPGTQGWGPVAGPGWAAGRGSTASLPGSGPTQVRSCPQGLNQVAGAPGGSGQTAGPGHRLPPRPSRADRDSREQRRPGRESPVESGCVPPRTCAFPAHTPVPAGDGPAEVRTQGGASPSAGRACGCARPALRGPRYPKVLWGSCAARLVIYGVK